MASDEMATQPSKVLEAFPLYSSSLELSDTLQNNSHYASEITTQLIQDISDIFEVPGSTVS